MNGSVDDRDLGSQVDVMHAAACISILCGAGNSNTGQGQHS